MNIDTYKLIYMKGGTDIMTQTAPVNAVWVPPTGTVINFNGIKEVVSIVEYHPLLAEIWIKLAR